MRRMKTTFSTYLRVNERCLIQLHRIDPTKNNTVLKTIAKHKTTRKHNLSEPHVEMILVAVALGRTAVANLTTSIQNNVGRERSRCLACHAPLRVGDIVNERRATLCHHRRRHCTRLHRCLPMPRHWRWFRRYVNRSWVNCRRFTLCLPYMATVCVVYADVLARPAFLLSLWLISSWILFFELNLIAKYISKKQFYFEIIVIIIIFFLKKILPLDWDFSELLDFSEIFVFFYESFF